MKQSQFMAVFSQPLESGDKKQKATINEGFPGSQLLNCQPL